MSIKERGPAGAGVKLVFAGKQRRVAADTVVDTMFMIVIVFPSPGTLCSMSSGHLVTNNIIRLMTPGMSSQLRQVEGSKIITAAQFMRIG